MSEQKLKSIANRINKVVGTSQVQSDKLEDIVASIEKSVEALQVKILGSSGSSSGSSVPTGASQAFDAYVEIIEGPLQNYLKLSKQIGGLVEKQSLEVEKAFLSQKDFLSKVVQSKEPDSATLQSLLTPLSQSIQSIQDIKEKNRAEKVLFNHIAAVSEGIPALGWVTVSPKPAPYVTQMKEAAEFYSNRVLKDYKDKDQTHKEWSQSFPAIIAQLYEFVKKYYTTGLTWGGAKILTASAPVATPAPTPAPASAPVSSTPAPAAAKKPEEKPKAAAPAVETPKAKELSALIERLEKNDPALKELNISGNEASNPEFGIRIGHALKTNTHLQKLLLSSSKQNNDSAIQIANGLKQNKTVEVFHIETNDIGLDGTLAFAEAIKVNTGVTEWKMANQATYAGIDSERAIAASFDSNQTITKFTYHGKDIGVNSIIDRALSRNAEIARQKKRAATGAPSAPSTTTKTETTATSSSTTTKAPAKEAPVGQMAKIIQRLEDNDPTLVDVELSKNAVCNAKHGALMGKALAKNTVVKKLLLDGTLQDNESAIEIANGLKKNKSLEILSLEDNDIGPEGMKAIADALAENGALLELRLRNQKKPAGVEGEKAFANAMEKNESLIKFSCQFKDPGVMNYVNRGITRNTERARQKRAENTPKIQSGPHMTAIQNAINSLKNNDANTTEINLNDNLVCNIQLTAEIASALEKNSRVKKLHLDNCFQNNESVTSLAKALKVNKTLEVLSLEHNDIGPEGFKALAESLGENTSLVELKLNHQKKPIGNDAERAMAEALDRNKTLTKLSITVKDIGARNTIDRILARNNELARAKKH